MTLFLALVVTAASPQGAHYPLAAVFIHGGRLVLADHEANSVRVLEAPGLEPLSGDVDRERRRVVFAARRAPGAPARLYLMTLANHVVVPLETDIAGDHQRPHFTHDSKSVMFSASDVYPGSPANPTSTRIVNLESFEVTTPPREQPATQCEFGSAPLGNEAVHVSTNCLVGFELRAKQVHKLASRKIAELGSPVAEFATSFDESKILYSVVDSGGTSLYLVDGKHKSTLVLRLDGETSSLQPAFICPRDVMFRRAGVAWILNTDTKRAAPMAALDARTDGGTP